MELPWGVKNRILDQMCRELRRYASTYVEPEDCAEMCRLTLEDLLDNEQIAPMLRVSLTGWFASEVLSRLTGDFDSNEAAD